MEYVTIGKDSVSVSRFGFGTGSSGFSGKTRQAELPVKELAGLLCHAFERGINFFDTSWTYGTYPHLCEALKALPRDKIVISSKFPDSLEKPAEDKIHETLKALKTGYLDICLLHGVRNAFDIKMRSGALKALIKAKKRGYVRNIGISSHGIGALEHASSLDEIDTVFSRINWSGASMDGYQEGLLLKAIAVPYVKEAARMVIPRRFVPSFSASLETPESSLQEQEKVKALLSRCAESGKSVVAMKVYGAGKLTGELERSLRFVMSLAFVKAFLIGITSRKELDENLKLYENTLVRSG